MGLPVLLVASLLIAGGCRDDAVGEAQQPEVAVTNSYLGCVVRDLCGADTGVLCLAPPGMCPGHFDLSPAQVRQLRGCRMLLLFDFQEPVEETLARLGDGGPAMHLIQAGEGLCVPETYLAMCRQVADVLAEDCPERAGQLRRRVAAIEERLNGLAAELKASVLQSSAASAQVLVSNHQARFASWLGLEPVATFVGSDVETMSNIDHCLREAAGREVRYVIANQQEGTALAKALAERVQGRAVVFSNFPPAGDEDAGFDRLLRANVSRLTQAVP